jgi:hypothetical protein
VTYLLTRASSELRVTGCLAERGLRQHVPKRGGHLDAAVGSSGASFGSCSQASALASHVTLDVVEDGLELRFILDRGERALMFAVVAPERAAPTQFLCCQARSEMAIRRSCSGQWKDSLTYCRACRH